MNPILYVETNLVIGIAKGQDLDGALLLDDVHHGVQLAFPSVCIMEAMSAWSFQKKSRNRFHKELMSYLNEIEPDATSQDAKLLARQINIIEVRLYQALKQLSDRAAIIHPDPDMIDDALANDYIEDPTDNLILCCILRHARLNPRPEKAFLSGDKGFGRPEVKKLLDSAGVGLFSKTKDALGWLGNPSARPAHDSNTEWTPEMERQLDEDQSTPDDPPDAPGPQNV